MIDISERRLLQEFPNFRVELRFSTLQPLFQLRITASVLEYHQLSVIARFMLRLIALEQSTLPRIAHLLGLKDVDLIDGGSELLQTKLIEEKPILQTGARQFVITPLGTAYLNEQRSVTVPTKRVFRLHFDPLTKQLRPYESTAVNPEKFRRDHLYVIDYDGKRPTRGEIELKKLRDAVQAEGYSTEEFEIVRIMGIGTPIMQYLPDVEVFVIEHQQTGEKRVAALYGAQYLPTVSEILQQQYRNGKMHIPTEAVPEMKAPDDLGAHAMLPAALAYTVEQVLEQGHKVETLRHEIERSDIVHSMTQDSRQRAELEKQNALLRQQLQEMEARYEQSHKQLQIATKELDVIDTPKHRAMLLQAFQDSTEEVIILSPWMTTDVIDNQLCSLIAHALRRGVKIRIGYGMGPERNETEKKKNQTNVQQVKKKIEQHTTLNDRKLLEVVDLYGSHAKVLVCDRKFGITGSFNWLSFRGDPGRSPRLELSTVHREITIVEKIASRALEAFEDARNRELVRRAIPSSR